MTVFNLINSQDVAYHLKQIQYPLSSMETAWMPRSQNHTLREKHAAWQEIIDNSAPARKPMALMQKEPGKMGWPFAKKHRYPLPQKTKRKDKRETKYRRRRDEEAGSHSTRHHDILPAMQVKK